MEATTGLTRALGIDDNEVEDDEFKDSDLLDSESSCFFLPWPRSKEQAWSVVICGVVKRLNAQVPATCWLRGRGHACSRRVRDGVETELEAGLLRLESRVHCLAEVIARV